MKNIIKALLITILIVGGVIGIAYLTSRYFIATVVVGIIGLICLFLHVYHSILKESEEE